MGGGGGTADTRETLERAPFQITKDIIVLQALVLSSSLPGKSSFIMNLSYDVGLIVKIQIYTKH